MNLLDKSIKDINIENDSDELNKEIKEYFDRLHKNLKDNSLPTFGRIEFRIIRIPFSYNTEKQTLSSLNKLGYIEIKPDSTHNESEKFSSKVKFINKYNVDNSTSPIIYKKELKDVDNVIYQTDKVYSSIESLNELLLKDGFIKEGNEYYMVRIKNYDEGDILDDVSKNFLITESYKFIEKNFIKDKSASNLNRMIYHNKQKRVSIIVFNLIKNKFLKKCKTKGLYTKKRSKEKK